MIVAEPDGDVAVGRAELGGAAVGGGGVPSSWVAASVTAGSSAAGPDRSGVESPSSLLLRTAIEIPPTSAADRTSGTTKKSHPGTPAGDAPIGASSSVTRAAPPRAWRPPS